LSIGHDEDAWQRITARFSGREISGSLEAPAGGWRKFEVRVSHEGKEFAKATVEHVGIGEVFIIAGQSYSANHGQEKLIPLSGRVVAFDGSTWQIANDPQPGASGKNGSFIPAFGDLVVEKLDVPVRIVACGIGSTSVREWLPKGSKFPNPPNAILSDALRVRRTPRRSIAQSGNRSRDESRSASCNRVSDQHQRPKPTWCWLWAWLLRCR